MTPVSQPLCASLLEKILEQAARTEHLIALIPEGREGSVARLLGHLLDCLSGFCAVLAAAARDHLAHFSDLRALPVNHACTPAEALSRIAIYRERYREGVGTIIDVLTAQSALENARAQEVQSRADYLLALAELAHATGKLGAP